MESNPPLPTVNRALCTLCGRCVDACPCHAIEMTKDGPVFHCGEQCPHGAACTKEGECWCLCQEACPEGAIECPFEIVFEDSPPPSIGAS
jgi:ferredoxin